MWRVLAACRKSRTKRATWKVVFKMVERLKGAYSVA